MAVVTTIIRDSMAFDKQKFFPDPWVLELSMKRKCTNINMEDITRSIPQLFFVLYMGRTPTSHLSDRKDSGYIRMSTD